MFYALFNLPQLTHYFMTKCFSKQLIHPRPIPTMYKRTIAATYTLIDIPIANTSTRTTFSSMNFNSHTTYSHTYIYRKMTNVQVSQSHGFNLNESGLSRMDCPHGLVFRRTGKARSVTLTVAAITHEFRDLAYRRHHGHKNSKDTGMSHRGSTTPQTGLLHNLSSRRWRCRDATKPRARALELLLASGGACCCTSNGRRVELEAAEEGARGRG
jgi:hypothetical protein